MPNTLEMTDVSTRTTSFKFELLDKAFNYIGTIYPDLSQEPTINNNINRTTKRTLEGLRLLAPDVAEINYLSDLLRVSAIVDDVEYPLGVFMWTDNPGSLRSYGKTGDNSMTDLTGRLDQPISRPLSYNAGASTEQAINDLAVEVGVTVIQLCGTGHQLGKPMSWAPDVSRMTILTDLANSAGCYSPFFNSVGVLITMQPAPMDTTNLVYEAGGRIVDGTIQLSNDLLSAPNRWLVVSTSANDSPVWGTYEVPAAAPHSFANRGFYVTETIQAQGLASNDEAIAQAKQAALSEDSTFEWADFEAIPDFRHDTFDVVQLLGNMYREQEWEIKLSAQATMKHSLRRHYE